MWGLLSTKLRVMNNSLIEIKDLYLAFGPNRRQAMRMLRNGRSKEQIRTRTNSVIAVDNVNLSIEEGEIFVVMGLSGSGKSSLLRCINMLNEPTSGTIKVSGKDVTKMDKKELLNFRRNEVGMVFQHFGLMPHRTIVENIAFGLEIQGDGTDDREAKAREMIELVGLSGFEDSYPDQLSGGMQQRVGIARALATDSKILLMDEAFSALDPLIRTQMQDDLLDIQQKLQKTIVFITHDLDEALKLGNQIAIMKDGQIVQQGKPDDILLNPANDYVKDFIGNVDMGKVITASTIMRPFRSRVTLGRHGPASANREMIRRRFHFMAVQDRNRVFKGYVRQKDINRLLREGDNDMTKIIIDVPKVSLDTHVTDLLPLFIDQTYPLVVVNEKGRAVGFITHSTVVSLVTGLSDGKVKDIIDVSRQEADKIEKIEGVNGKSNANDATTVNF